MESKEEKQDEQGNLMSANIIVVEHTKSSAGDRNVFLTKEAKRILAMIKDWNKEHGFGDSKYVFLNSMASEFMKMHQIKEFGNTAINWYSGKEHA